MSTFRPYLLTCPCGHQHTVDLVDGIHITRLPDARRQILDGAFQRFTCPACGVETAVEKQAVYTDFERYEYVAVETRIREPWPTIRARHQRIFDDSFRSGPPLAGEIGVRFRKRAVIGFGALREKLVLWDGGLDDLVVEAVKGDLLDEDEVHPADRVLRLASVLDGGHLLFAAFEPAPPRTADLAGVRIEEPDRQVDLRTALADHYLDRLHHRATIADDYPWLAEDWLVDLHDGYFAWEAERR
jgi:hypothetical protein